MDIRIFDYIHAETLPGEDELLPSVQRDGHSMVRLRTCAPSRATEDFLPLPTRSLDARDLQVRRWSLLHIDRQQSDRQMDSREYRLRCAPYDRVRGAFPIFCEYRMSPDFANFSTSFSANFFHCSITVADNAEFGEQEFPVPCSNFSN